MSFVAPNMNSTVFVLFSTGALRLSDEARTTPGACQAFYTAVWRRKATALYRSTQNATELGLPDHGFGVPRPVLAQMKLLEIR